MERDVLYNPMDTGLRGASKFRAGTDPEPAIGMVARESEEFRPREVFLAGENRPSPSSPVSIGIFD